MIALVKNDKVVYSGDFGKFLVKTFFSSFFFNFCSVYDKNQHIIDGILKPILSNTTLGRV